eukprot:GFYU01002405.1.p1 GENE.GFYU01002405.1~~GFYU01002405.1.p1  ORF type:complete len:312 (-),score=78.60 GFYU01002405.1:298-1233(-)
MMVPSKEVWLAVEATSADFAAVRKILTRSDIDVNWKNPEQEHQTALHLAVKQNNVELVKELLSHGADVGVRDQNKRTPIHLASHLQYHDCVDALVNAVLPHKELPTKLTLSTVEDALKAIARGEFIVVVDDPERENECDLIIASDKMTAEKMAFMVRWTSGIICVSITAERAQELNLPMMVVENTDSHKTAFTVSCDYNIGTTTGISAADRALTTRALIDPATTPTQLNRPGHMFPLVYTEGGVLSRAGHTEASLDLARLAGCAPSGVLSEIVKDDGSMMRPENIAAFCKEHKLEVITVEQLQEHMKAQAQ